MQFPLIYKCLWTLLRLIKSELAGLCVLEVGRRWSEHAWLPIDKVTQMAVITRLLLQPEKQEQDGIGILPISR